MIHESRMNSYHTSTQSDDVGVRIENGKILLAFDHGNITNLETISRKQAKDLLSELVHILIHTHAEP